jgi:hypothetical protein
LIAKDGALARVAASIGRLLVHVNHMISLYMQTVVLD